MRTRRFDTRAGSIELAIPKLRRGSYFQGGGTGSNPVGGATGVVAGCLVPGSRITAAESKPDRTA
jgi:hypothetical protein